jgi:serine/threonine protein kinase
MRLEPGSTLGRYLIRSALGAGGMGEVYLANDPVLDRLVALKVVTPGMDDADLLDRFKREACAASALNHPNIITIYEFAEDAGTRYIATEYVDGVTVRQRIAREQGPLRLSDAVEIGRQIAAALAAAHGAGIVHRDLKPDNVMIRPDGYVKVLDFGLAKRVVSAPGTSAVQTELGTTAGTLVGTIEYMSPEQVRGLPLDARTDVWSLGCVLYEMITGRRPFDAPNRLDIMASVLDREPQAIGSARPDCPPALATLVTRMLGKDRDARPQSMAEVGRDLERIAESLRETPAAKSWTGQRVAAIAALAMVVLALGAWVLMKPGRSTASPSADPSRSAATSAGVLPAARSLEFWLDVQRMRDGKPYKEQFPSSGREIFDPGDKFRLHASSAQPGRLYIVNEGPGARGTKTLRLLYPDSGSEGATGQRLAPGTPIGTVWYVFDDQSGPEHLEYFWIVSSPGPVPALEAARRFVNAEDRGDIHDETIAAGVARLLRDTGRPAPRVSVDQVKKRTTVESTTPLLVHLVQLEHH